MNFERNKDVLVVLDAGRSKTAFLVEKTWVCVVVWDSASDLSGANIGRYFKAPNSQDFEVFSSYEYEFLSLVLKRDEEGLNKMASSFLKNYSSDKSLLFVFRFEGEYWEEAEKRKENPKLYGKLKTYYFQDLYGKDLKFKNGKFLHLPDSRLLSNSDFQLHLKGTGK